MNEKPEPEGAEKVDVTYEENAPRETGEDIYSYKHILLTQSKWAWPSTGWQLVGGWAIVVFGCIACYLILVVMNRGWDGLLTLLGWK